MREWLQQNQGMATAIAVVILVVALALVFLRGGGEVAGAGTYYYDLNTNQLFVSREARYAPFDTPSGPTPDGQPAGVEAMVYGCDQADCAEPAVEHVAYVVKHTPRGLQLIEEIAALAPDEHDRRLQLDMELMTQKLARRLNDTEWVSAGDPRITGVVREIRHQRCGGRQPVLCNP
jgi:hypothetical protein